MNRSLNDLLMDGTVTAVCDPEVMEQNDDYAMKKAAGEPSVAQLVEHRPLKDHGERRDLSEAGGRQFESGHSVALPAKTGHELRHSFGKALQ